MNDNIEKNDFTSRWYESYEKGMVEQKRAAILTEHALVGWSLSTDPERENNTKGQMRVTIHMEREKPHHMSK